MQLWAAAVLFIACAGAAVIFIKLYSKSKKARFIVLTAILSLLALTFLAYSGLTLVLLGGVNDTNYMAERAAELLAAGRPTIYDSKEPFALGGISGEPTEEKPWWTLEYGSFPVILSSAVPAGLAENFAEAQIGYPNRDKGSNQFVTSSDGTMPGSRDYLMEDFLEGNEEHVGGDYYDYELGIRFESASVNLLLLTEINQIDRDYLESKGGKAAAEEIARTALVFMVPADFPADNLSLEQLKSVLSGDMTDLASLGIHPPISLHYSLNDDFLHMLDTRILRGVSLAGSAWEDHEVGTGTTYRNIPYDNQPGGVGIFAYGEAPKIGGSKILTIEGAAPSEETISSGEYPVYAGVYAVYWETDRDNAPGRFAEWCASGEGAAAIRASGLVPAK